MSTNHCSSVVSSLPLLEIILSFCYTVVLSEGFKCYHQRMYSKFTECTVTVSRLCLWLYAATKLKDLPRQKNVFMDIQPLHQNNHVALL